MPHIESWRDIFNRQGFRSALRGSMRYWFGKRGQRLVSGLRLYYRVRYLVLLRTGEPIAKLARKRDVKLWVDGSECYKRLEKLIRKAKYQIVIQMFIWKNDETGRRIASLLIDAADRGVNIDITKEAVGDFFEFRGDFLGTKDSNEKIWKRFWNHSKIRINYTTNNDHTKVFIFDGHTLLLTGMNIANEYRERWHDYMVELRGIGFVEQFLTRKSVPDIGQSVRLIMNTDESKDMRKETEALLKSAREHAVIEHCYLSDPAIIQILIDLTKRGVKLTIIMPKWTDFHHHANLGSIGTLLSDADSSNLTILIYPDMFHAKAIMIDHSAAFVGSLNLFKGSIDEMGEVNVLVRGRYHFIWRLRESIRKNILKSRPVNSPPSFLWISRWLAWLGL